MIDNININQTGQTLGKTFVPQPDPATMRPTNDLDATLQVNFADILNQARQAEEADTDALHKARELLFSGRLLSHDNIRAAADEIINSGI